MTAFELTEIETLCGVTRADAEAARNDSYVVRAAMRNDSYVVRADRYTDRDHMGEPLKVVVPAGYSPAIAQAGARLATGMPVTYDGMNAYGHHVYTVTR